MNFIKYSLAVLSQANFIEKVGFIIFCLTANGFFPDLPIDLPDITSKLSDYEDKLDKSRKGDKVATAQAKKLRNEIQSMLKQNGFYVNITANGDIAMLESSGYDLAKERTLTAKPVISITPTSNPGEIKVFIRRIEGALAYQVLICEDEVPPPDKQYLWLRKPMTNKVYQLLKNIVALKQYYLIFCSVSKDGESAMSDPVPFMILK
jgi:hypothetical protein